MSEQTQTASGGGIGVLGLLGVVFVTLRLCGVINWSWWWVTAPFWGGLALLLAIVLVGLIVLGVAVLVTKCASAGDHLPEGDPVKKMPCLFVRRFDGRRIAGITPEVSPGAEWVLAGEGVATVKHDGTACLFDNGKLFKRYDAKQGKKPPPGFAPCQPDPDPITLHWPGWVPVVEGDPASKWHYAAWLVAGDLPDGTYELCGPHFQTNPYRLLADEFRRHGAEVLADAPRDFDGLRESLRTFAGEGIVFHHPDGRMAKIRRDDFGYPWPVSA